MLYYFPALCSRDSVLLITITVPIMTHWYFDRIPMTLVFMSFLSATISECINIRAGKYLLFPLLIAGITSVLWWHHTESVGRGDLRFYGFAQFYPIIFAPLIYLFFRSSIYKKGFYSLVMAIGWYAIAKVFEHFDKDIYSFTGFISGHSVKHLAAAVATWFLVKMFAKKHL